MPWEYLEEEAIADIGIKVTGKDLTELFTDACLSIAHLMTKVDELDELMQKAIQFEETSLDLLLHSLLEEMVYLKDAELFFVKSVDLHVDETENGFAVKGKFVGDLFDPEVDHIGNDIKAITMHDFYVRQEGDGWVAHFIIDI
ncbi:MAG: archease [Methanobacteriota archaeon]|nr:MAG: archease [Euryarchaeota archaeon]